MKKRYILYLILIVMLAGCQDTSTDEEAEPAADPDNADAAEMADDAVIATVEDHEITGEAVENEWKRLELIAALQGEDPESSPDVSKSAAVQELIRSYMIRQIADDEDIEVDEDKQAERAQAVRDEIESTDVYQSIMEDVDEEAFWEREEDRYETILASEKLVEQFMTHKQMNKNHDVAEAAGEAEQDERTLKHNARETLDSWIQEELRDVDVEVNLES